MFAIAVREIKTTYPPPFWLYGTRWRGLPYRGVFRAFYAPKFSPLEIAKKKGQIHYGSYRRPIEANWTDKRMLDRMREGPFDEAVPNPLNSKDSKLLFKLESKHEDPFDDGISDRERAEKLLPLYQKIEKNVTLIFYRIINGTRKDVAGFRFLGYDYADFGGDRSSRLFDLLFQEWAEGPEEIEFVNQWRRRLNDNGLFSTMEDAREWQKALEAKKPHPSCCRGGDILEIYEQASLK